MCSERRNGLATVIGTRPYGEIAWLKTRTRLALSAWSVALPTPDARSSWKKDRMRSGFSFESGTPPSSCRTYLLESGAGAVSDRLAIKRFRPITAFPLANRTSHPV